MTPNGLVGPVVVTALALLAWVLFRLYLLNRRGDVSGATRLARTSGAVWLVGLLLVTLGGRPQDAYGTIYFNWIPFATQVMTYEIAANALMFVPAGLLLPWILLRIRRWRVVLISIAGAVLLSALVEITQTFTPLGTAGDLTDILLNTAGCAVAALAAAVAGKLSEVVGRKKYEVRSDSAGRVGG